MCFVWISEQTAIISLYNINWLIFITERECLLRGMDWIFAIFNFHVLMDKVVKRLEIPTSGNYGFSAN